MRPQVSAHLQSSPQFSCFRYPDRPDFCLCSFRISPSKSLRHLPSQPPNSLAVGGTFFCAVGAGFGAAWCVCQPAHRACRLAARAALRQRMAVSEGTRARKLLI